MSVSYTHLDVYKRQVLVYQQMIGAIIKAMMEEKIQISKFMGNGRQAYTTIAEKDTIEEIELFVKGFIRQIQDYLGEVTEEKEDVKLYDRIITYLDEHYKEDIDYEEAAGEIGISYSCLLYTSPDIPSCPARQWCLPRIS